MHALTTKRRTASGADAAPGSRLAERASAAVSLRLSILLLGLAAAGMGATEVPAQAPEIDTAAVVRFALVRFPTTNGPFVQVASSLRCGQDRCRAGAADTVLADVAVERGADLVPAEAPIPPCVWNDAAQEGRKGLRIEASPIQSLRGETAVAVRVTCAGGPEATHSRFWHEIHFKVERVEGRWTTTDVLEQAIT